MNEFRHGHKSKLSLHLVIMFTAIILLLLSAPLLADDWDLGGKVSVYDENGKLGLKAAATAEYSISSALAWRTDLELLMKDGLDPSDFDLSVPSNLLWYPLAHKAKIDPYCGPGIVLTYTSSNRFLFGLNVLGGVDLLLKNKRKVGIEVKYTVRNINNWSGSDTFEMGLTGKWEIEL